MRNMDVMFLIHLITAAIVAILLSILLAGLFNWHRPGYPEASFGATLLFLFIFLLLPIWAIGAWLIPAGPMLYGSPWMGFFFVGLLLALMVLALAPAEPPETRRRGDAEIEERMARQAREETGPAMATAIVWIFIVLALAFIIAAYIP